MSSGVRLAAATALICGATLGGYMAMTSDSGSSLPTSAPSPMISAPYKGPSMSRSQSAPRSASEQVIAHETLGGSSSSRATISPSFSVNNASQASPSIGLLGAPTVPLSGAKGTGGGGGSAGLSTGGVTTLAMASSRGGSSSSPLRSMSRLSGGQTGGKAFGGDLTVYEGDAPGIIIGAENSSMDNPIIVSYEQPIPIGSSILPLLFFTILFICYKRKNMLKYISHITPRSKRTSACLLAMCTMLAFFSTRAWAKVQTVNGKTYNVVYMSSAGAGKKTGDDAANAVKGWANAYDKLSKTGGTYEDDWNYNIIVITGSADIAISITEDNTKDIPATITNVWPWEDNSGNSLVSGSGVSGGCKLTVAGTARTSRIGAPTRFKNVCFTSGGNDCRMCLFLYHTMFDVGCVMNNMGTLSTDMGAMDKTTHKAPSFHLMLFSDENDFTQTTSPASAPWNQTEPMTLTIKSGRFGRILCTRIAGTTWSSQTSRRYTIGKPDQPLMAKIEVDIDPSTNTSDYNPTGYKDDIAFLCAGTTQGTVFADVQMDIKRGQIATIVGGSQGNAIQVCADNGIPTSTYCGRTTVNVIGEKDSDVKIFRYFGGCLGRFTDKATGTCSAYFYGHSILNFVHGTIEQDIFASGGGLSGLRNPNNGAQHTSDQFIPYQGGSNPAYPFLGIDYSSFDASKNIVQITSVLKGSTPEVIDLADTKIITNISGGVVKGNVYGGSYGYSSEMVLKGAPEGAGSLWGNTEVNISGGEIQGSVFGGGAGAKSYYNLADNNADRNKFLTVATVYGNTNLTIMGKPTIQGNIFGGGAGLSSQEQNAKDTIDVAGTITYKTGLTANDFVDIAKVYGNTNVTINADDDWEYTGNIYGGGALGSVEGDTNVNILGGIINGNVFGGGKGEEGHPDKAKVSGDTNVIVGEEAVR